MAIRQITDEVSEAIWKYIWDNAGTSETDEDLLDEYAMYKNWYENRNPKFQQLNIVL